MDRRAMVLALVLTAAVGGPFLGKAFHIDDTFVLKVSRQILRDPLHPYDAEINWGRGLNTIFERTKNPPLLSYYLAPLLRFCGPSEIALHAAMLVFLFLLALGTALLGRWFWVDEWWPMLFVMFSPAVMVSPNVMRDVPAAGLLTLGLALFVLGTDEDRHGLMAAGSVLFGLATLTKYSAAALLPLLVIYPLLRRKPLRMLWVLVPVAFLGLWSLHNWWSQGIPHIALLLRQRAEKLQGFGRPRSEKLVAGLAIAGSSLFLLPALLVGWLRKWLFLALPLVVAAGAAGWLAVTAHFTGEPLGPRPDLLVQTNGGALAGTRVEGQGDYVHLRIRDDRVIRLPRPKVQEVSPQGDYVVRAGGRKLEGTVVADTEDFVVIKTHGWRTVRRPQAGVDRVEKLSWQYYLWATTGAALLAVALVGGVVGAGVARKRREEGWAEWLFLAAWVGGGVAFSVLFTPFQAVRHFLPIIAPLVVLVLGLIGRRRRHVQVVLTVVLVLQAAVAYVVALADAEYAATYRTFAREAARAYATEDVWFNGHWGWQHYCQDVHGFHHYWHFRDDGSGPPPPGALLLEPEKVHHRPAARRLGDRLVELPDARRVFHPVFPVRTMDQLYAYFYATTTHRMPYILTLADTPIETCHVYRIAPEPPPPAEDDN
ncbi:MAG: hypothetical protein ACOC8D_02675 [bacterium]